MATVNIPILSGSNKGDTNATANTLVLRDNAGGVFGAVVSGSQLQTSGTYQGNISLQTASFTAGSATHYFIDATSAAITVTLPLASANAGIEYHFWKVDAVHSITLSGTVGVTTMSTQHQWIMCVSDGTNWNAG